jgi:hypothetical protein
MTCADMPRLKYGKSSGGQKIEIVPYRQAHCLVHLYARLTQLHQSASSDASYDNAVYFMSSQGTERTAHAMGVMLVRIADCRCFLCGSIYQNKDRR